jgi:ABC-type multidrug transport system fused ATPase/permease subunit
VFRWYGATLVIAGELSVGVLLSYTLYTITVGVAFGGLSGLFASIMQALGACDRVFELLDRVPALALHGGRSLSSAAFHGHVEFRDVFFRYPTRPDVPVLRGVSFELRPGTVTALVGFSGSGKSTVVALLERFYGLDQRVRDDTREKTAPPPPPGTASTADSTGASVGEPSAVKLSSNVARNDDDGDSARADSVGSAVGRGSILLDGVDLRSLDASWLHRHLALVSQEPSLFCSSIRANLTYGVDGPVSDTQLEHACTLANALEFVNAFPERFETLVGERGVRLSGGQKQRLAIARALLLEPRVLLADEATSALDSESEHLVQLALDRLMAARQRTILVIAHRLSTVKNADQVLVLDRGQIQERGTHAQLIARNGLYARLVRRQLTHAAAADDEQGDSAAATDDQTSASKVRTETAGAGEFRDTPFQPSSGLAASAASEAATSAAKASPALVPVA